MLAAAQALTAILVAQTPPMRGQVPVQPGGKLPALIQVVPGLTSAAVVIDFEDQTTNGPGQGPAVITDQYAAKGVVFNHTFVLDYSKGLAIPDFAHGTRAIEQCYGIEFCEQPIIATFSLPQARVKVWVGYSSRHQAGRIVLTARDANGQVIDQRAVAVPAAPGPAPIDQSLEIADERARIASVEIAQEGLSPSGLAVDDLEFARTLTPVPGGDTPTQPPSNTDTPASQAPFDLALGAPFTKKDSRLTIVVPITVAGAPARPTTIRAEAAGWEGQIVSLDAQDPGEYAVEFTLPPGTYEIALTVTTPRGQREATLANNAATIAVVIAAPAPPVSTSVVVGAAAAFVVLAVVVGRLMRKPSSERTKDTATGTPRIAIEAHPDPGTSRVINGSRGAFDVRIRASSGPAGPPVVVEGSQIGMVQKEYL
jgi:hypothetical protein